MHDVLYFHPAEPLCLAEDQSFARATLACAKPCEKLSFDEVINAMSRIEREESRPCNEDAGAFADNLCWDLGEQRPPS